MEEGSGGASGRMLEDREEEGDKQGPGCGRIGRGHTSLNSAERTPNLKVSDPECGRGRSNSRSLEPQLHLGKCY